MASLYLSWIAILLSCAGPSANHGVKIPVSRAIAFPGAEGFGKFATGGRGGKVFIVTNLDDEGTGSFRQAATAREPRIIVFAVSGTIHLQSPLNIQGNVTIAGQTAPGDGICLADYPVKLNGDNIILRYLRFRMGDKNQNKGMVDGAGADDALGGTKRTHLMIDHCSISWSTDECFSVYSGDSTTLQWNLISEPLNYSYHFETGDKDFENHGYGGIWGGSHLSAHHNLFAHCASRTPRFNGTRLGAMQEFVDYRNNVIYNWGGNNVYGGEAGNYNVVGNYYKYGPSTGKKVRSRIVNPTKTTEIGFGKFFVDGNYVDGAADVTGNNFLGVHMGDGTNGEGKNDYIVTKPFPAVDIVVQSAAIAYQEILQKVGASYKRDTLDQRIIADVENRKGRFIDVQGGYPHGTTYDLTIHAWPLLKSSAPLMDSDKDGMPDEWEKMKGLDPQNPSDAVTRTLDHQYSNIEMYFNQLLK